MRFTRILAQTPRDAQRLRELGARAVEVCGNTKFDATPPVKQLARGHEWRQQLPRSVVLGAQPEALHHRGGAHAGFDGPARARGAQLRQWTWTMHRA